MRCLVVGNTTVEIDKIETYHAVKKGTFYWEIYLYFHDSNIRGLDNFQSNVKVYIKRKEYELLVLETEEVYDVVTGNYTGKRLLVLRGSNKEGFELIKHV